MKKSIYFFTLSILFISCKTANQNVICTLDTLEIPVKLLEAQIKQDSTYVTLMIPKKLTVKNNYRNRIRLSLANLSIDEHGGGNGAKYRIYGVNDSLNTPLYQINFKRNQKKEYSIYLGYTLKIDNTEKEIILKNATFSQKRQGKNIYDIGFMKEVNYYLQQKIPDSIKGYLTSTFYNNEINGYFKEAVQVKF